MKAVIAGCGLIASRWTRTVLADGRTEIDALVDANHAAALQLADRYGLTVPVYARIEDALAHHELDVLINLTPPDRHAPTSTTALHQGLHVLTEKPLATSLGDAAALVTLAEERQLVLQVMQNRGQDPGWVTFTREVRRHDRGPLHASVEVAVELPATGFRVGMAEVGTVDLAVHGFDQVRQLITSPAVEVFAEETPLPFLARHCTAVTAAVRFEDGSLLSYRGGYTAGPGRRSSANGLWQVEGRDVHATWNGQTEASFVLADHTQAGALAFPEATPGYAACITKMISTLFGERTGYPGARYSLVSMALLDAALSSIRTGRRCQVETVDA